MKIEKTNSDYCPDYSYEIFKVTGYTKDDFAKFHEFKTKRGWELTNQGTGGTKKPFFITYSCEKFGKLERSSYEK